MGPMSTVPTIELNDGHSIPQLGFGVFQIPHEETAEAVRRALEVGYRHIDTAQMYGNESEVGEAVRASGLDRADVFVTTKLSNSHHRPADAREAFDRSLSKLGSDYVDLFLIHWPLPMLYDGDYVSTWKTLEELQAEGRARSIGVSNFQVDHLERLADECDVVPTVNQIELHPYFQNEDVRRYGEARGTATQAWSPIAQGEVLDDPAIGEIADRVGRSPAQHAPSGTPATLPEGSSSLTSLSAVDSVARWAGRTRPVTAPAADSAAPTPSAATKPSLNAAADA